MMFGRLMLDHPNTSKLNPTPASAIHRPSARIKRAYLNQENTPTTAGLLAKKQPIPYHSPRRSASGNEARRTRNGLSEVTDNLPKFNDPPVIEAVLGVQFSPLEGYTSAHAGWFWRDYLGDSWPSSSDAQLIANSFEKFGKDERWSPRQLTISPAESIARSQFSNPDDERMIQVQNTRLHYNWRKQQGHYPSYQGCRVPFLKTWSLFNEFCERAKLGKVEPNQWEITYFNHVPRGDLWSEFSDLLEVFPFISSLPLVDPCTILDGGKFSWRSALRDQAGRLHISLEHVRVGGIEGPEAIRLTLTARGPIGEQSGNNLATGLDIGHEAIVRYFAAMTSESAHKYWERTQ